MKSTSSQSVTVIIYCNIGDLDTIESKLNENGSSRRTTTSYKKTGTELNYLGAEINNKLTKSIM